MADVALVDDVLATREVDHDAFLERAAEERDELADAIAEGTFDNPGGAVGLEYEFYAVAAPTAVDGDPPVEESARLMRVPRRLLEMIGFEKELGLHNAEMCTSPQPLNRFGVAAQEAEVRSRLEAAQSVTLPEGMRLVSDGLWTISPQGETAREYLTASAVEEGVAIATNMSDAVRYHSMANSDVADVGLLLEAPNVSLDAETVMPESLITSIQPHFQVPQAEDVPEYHRYALRIAAPLLAVCANSPFFPPDLYEPGTSIEDAVEEGWDAHRIAVFETVLNESRGSEGKVRFPRDLASTEDALDRILTDDLLVPVDLEEQGRYDDRYAHLRHKHGSYWRWIRPVFDGATRSEANARIEFRPIAAQPTVRDSVAVLVAFAGSMVGFTRFDHPLGELAWERAHENFYAAMRDGVDADLAWITRDGRETRDLQTALDDLLSTAAEGLVAAGLGDERIDRYLDPLRARAERRTSPATWKRERARAAARQGADLEGAITSAQREYVDHQAETLLEGTFTDWW